MLLKEKIQFVYPFGKPVAEILTNMSTNRKLPILGDLGTRRDERFQGWAKLSSLLCLVIRPGRYRHEQHTKLYIL